MDEGDESPHAEAYRVLRTNILFAGRKSEDQTTFTVVSGGAGEGKTTTMFNWQWCLRKWRPYFGCRLRPAPSIDAPLF